MPGENDAVVKLLMGKYGLPFEEADAYAYKIHNGEAGSRGTNLQEEAMAALVGPTLNDYADLVTFSRDAANPAIRNDPNLNKRYRERLDESADNTVMEAATAKYDRDIALNNTAAAELARIVNMLNWSEGITPLPANEQGTTRPGYLSQHEPPGDFSSPLIPAFDRAVSPDFEQKGRAGVPVKVEAKKANYPWKAAINEVLPGSPSRVPVKVEAEKVPESVATIRLQRAMKLRKHILGE